ncbi:MAG TPA: six-hairpin glycosidase, partial [Anseongella sp.]|nr:six-hairpin glycosidase [Anseongella sp.]
RGPENTSCPFYKTSDDKGFVSACEELLSQPLMMQQWVEEADRDDPLIPLKEEYKAFSYYHLPGGRVVGWWKHALTSISEDGGKTWLYRPLRAPGFVNANAKIWGQKTSDGRYATVYNPSEFRWPLAVSTSDDGLEYSDLLLVNGEITAMRYGGNYKSYGPQYVRGILEGNGVPPGGKLWVTYSMNKEDIWVASIPVPVEGTAKVHVSEVFEEMPEGRELEKWNIYSPVLAPVGISELEDGTRGLLLRDSDRFDYAKAERLFPPSEKLSAEFSLLPFQNDKGLLHIEFQDAKGTAAVRLILDSDSVFKTKAGYRLSGITGYEAGRQYDIKVELDAPRRYYEVFVNGKKEKAGIFFAPVHSLERIVFRTGEVRRFPNADTPTDQSYDLPDTGEPVEPA